MSRVVQVDLRNGSNLMTCWVEPKVKVGNLVTLKDTDEPSRLWEVLRVGREHERSDIKRGWNNNY